MTDAAAPEDPPFDCPRCQKKVQERFYGPCPSCRAELRRTLGTTAKALHRTAFEPTMHVAPNAVATKD